MGGRLDLDAYSTVTSIRSSHSLASALAKTSNEMSLLRTASALTTRSWASRILASSSSTTLAPLSRPFTRSAFVANTNDGNDAKESLPGKAGNILESVLYGSKKTKEEESTYSKKLARGKYVHELQKHKVKPERVEDYIKLISVHYPRIANDPENHVNLCGSWQAEVGDLDSFTHLWEYKGYPGHKATMARLHEDKQYQQFIRDLRPMLVSRENQMCLEFAFWATSPPRVTHGIYELRSYLLKPGNLLEWELNWRKGLEYRSQFCEPVGAWFSQLGPLNYVHHMWNYPDLQARKETREQAWQINGWAETVYNTVRLINTMNASILSPLPFSPLK